ncbi:hypothetical protein RRF57_007091 [Xylaria bambusicola]|uniref:UmuC domain-containing protein n=1 Tax=Xylaria bambusicola TaxID=326684 RepID=A0AAN7UM79_9PEZI
MRTTSLTPKIAKQIKIPKRNDDRIILHFVCSAFDYDCFYASVFENENPSLKSQPLGIKQKSILATCNYVARARGVKKLMLISEAQKICPDLILMNGEDLTRFRDVSKKLWAFLRAHSWNRRVERLGLDEVFLDVTDIIAYNRELLNVHALGTSFFQLDRNDPVKGFAFDGSRFYGCTQPDDKLRADRGLVDVENPLCVRLMLASHLAGYLRRKLDEDFGYTSSGGISTNKLLAKLAGNVNKPNNQTTLLAKGGDGADAVEAFMDTHSIRKVPGIGSRIAQLMEEYLLSRPAKLRDREGNNVTIGEARRCPGMSSDLLEQILDRPGAERGSGEKVWNFLHGVDLSEVKEASDVPTQISIEDTYMSRPLQTPAEVNQELHTLATSLIRRMRVDLTEAEIKPTVQSNTTSCGTPHWLAYPKTLRLSTRTKSKQSIPASSTSTNGAEVPNFSRSSRSAPLPSFVFQFSPPSPSTSSLPSTSTCPSPATLSCEEIASRLVTESLLPLFRRLHPSRGGGLNLALLNICVTNMVLVARDEVNSGSGSGPGSGSSMAPGRDISRMFRTQEDKLREWTVYDTSPFPASAAPHPPSAPPSDIDINTTSNLIRYTAPTGESTDGYPRDDEAIADLVMMEDEDEDEESDAQFQGRRLP